MAETGKDILKAESILRKGGLVAIPTETVYGLAADATNPRAVARIFQAKNRPHFDPLIVHLHDLSHLDEYCQDVPPLFYKLYESFSPGPITYILSKTPKIPDLVTSGHETVGIRFPRHPLTRELLFNSELALAAPSANPFGYVSPTTAAHVKEQLGEEIDYILDGGPCTVGLESTIIDLTSNASRILRLGGIPIEEIEEVTGPIEVNQSSTSNPSAPGMLSSHYAPSKNLAIRNIGKFLEEHSNQNVGVISFHKSYPQVPKSNQFVLSPKGNLAEAASKLFTALRELDQLNVDLIVAEMFPDEGLGRAINDRLKRASQKE